MASLKLEQALREHITNPNIQIKIIAAKFNLKPTTLSAKISRYNQEKESKYFKLTPSQMNSFVDQVKAINRKLSVNEAKEIAQKVYAEAESDAKVPSRSCIKKTS